MLFFVDEEVVDVDGCYVMGFVECALLLVLNTININLQNFILPNHTIPVNQKHTIFILLSCKQG